MNVSFISPDEDCMGNMQPGYYRGSHTCSDGSVVLGTGSTAELAEQSTERQRLAHENFLASSPAEQLKILVAGDLLDTDQRRAIRLLAELVLRRDAEKQLDDSFQVMPKDYQHRQDVEKQLAALTKEFGIPKMPNIGCSASDIGG